MLTLETKLDVTKKNESQMMQAAKTAIPLSWSPGLSGSQYLPVRKTRISVGDAKVTCISRGKHDIFEKLESGRKCPFLVDSYDQSGIFVVLSLKGRMFCDVKHRQQRKIILLKEI